MPRYVAFLRAVNVGGRFLKMDRLRALCEAVPLRNVETFIASGNVLFDSRSADVAALEGRIEKHLERALGYEVLTFVRSADEVARVAAHEPFGDPAAVPRTHMIYIGFLKTTPSDGAREKLSAHRERLTDVHVHGREVYWRVERNMRLLGNAALIEKTLGPATMRTVTTVRKLAQTLAAPSRHSRAGALLLLSDRRTDATSNSTDDVTDFVTRANAWVNGIVWGPPMLVLLMGTGLLLTVVTGAVQFRHIGTALGEVLGKLRRGPAGGEGNVTPFQAVATALASTVGVGNIAGVATALTLGGPGALFWLWVSGLLGMGTKFAEIVVALHYRERDAAGVMRGGAMYTLKKRGLGWLGGIFALLTALAAFGIGNMVQANSVAQSLNTTFGVSPAVVGAVLVVVAGAVILGGIKRIAAFAELLVPFMAVVYVVGGLAIVLTHLGEVPRALGLVFDGAFSGTAATGGFAGSTIMLAMRYGVARGLFSNEAGLGSAPMVHAAATTDHPVRQGLYGIFEVFVDTILICTTTGLVILVTDTWASGETGAALSVRAFETGLPGTWGDIVVTTGLVLFAFSTLIGWSYYGETGAVYLLGTRAAFPYRILWLVFIYLGAVGSLHLVWDVADTLNGLMAMPNLVSVLISIPLLRRLQREFFERGGARATVAATTRGAGRADGPAPRRGDDADGA